CFPSKATLLVIAAILLGGPTPARAGENGPEQVARLAAAIDEQIEVACRNESIAPAPLADDAEFLPPISVDLLGRIPSVGEIRLFLADTDPNKRRRIADRMLESPAYFTHSTVKWRNALIPRVDADQQTRFQVPGFDAWLRQRLVSRTAHDH